MLKLLIMIFGSVCVLEGAAQNKVVATVSNFENSKGVCRACLFNSAAAFEQEKPLQCQNIPVANKSAQVVFANVADGTYAVFVFHDTNNNGRMDTNFLGIPKEGYGASKNKLPFAAAPKFEANKFSVSGGQAASLSIRLRNL